MTRTHTALNRRTYLVWLVLSMGWWVAICLGATCITVVFTSAVMLIGAQELAIVVFIGLGAFLSGLGGAVLQTWLLTAAARPVAYWYRSTIGGWIIGVCVGVLLALSAPQRDDGRLFLMIFGSVGVTTGVSQWWVLQRRTHQVWWIVGNSLAGLGSGVVGQATFVTVNRLLLAAPQIASTPEAGLGALYGAGISAIVTTALTFGLATGVMFVHLNRRQPVLADPSQGVEHM